MKALCLLLFLWSSAAVGLPETIPPAEMPTCEEDGRRVNLTLRNSSFKKIPLIIPGVMKPNLSPLSNSGVDLKVGQKILFKYKGKRRLLLKVDRRMAGETLNVSKLMKEQKRMIDKGKKWKGLFFR